MTSHKWISSSSHGDLRNDFTYTPQVLKLSYNRLSVLRSWSLRGARELTRLHLDHNRLTSLDADALLGLTSLRMLTLEGNALTSLPPGGLMTLELLSGLNFMVGGSSTFRVSTLRHLSLADNALTSLPAALLPATPLLETLTLHGNPWACDCAHAAWVGDWTPGVRGQRSGTSERAGLVREGNVTFISCRPTPFFSSCNSLQEGQRVSGRDFLPRVFLPRPLQVPRTA